MKWEMEAAKRRRGGGQGERQMWLAERLVFILVVLVVAGGDVRARELQ